MAGGAAATLLLAAGMTVTIHGFDVIATAQVSHLRAKEEEITLVERLRWSGEVMVSAGRGYLLTGDPALLTGLTHATSRFDREGAQLTSAVDDPFAAEVAEAADRFISKQKALIARATGTRTVTFWCVDSRKSCYLCSALSRSRSIGWWSTRKTRSRKFTR